MFNSIEYGGTGQITSTVMTPDGVYILRLYNSSNNKQSILTWNEDGAIVSKHTASEIELYKRKFNAVYDRDLDLFKVLLGTVRYNMQGADCAEMLLEFSKPLVNSTLTNLYANSVSKYIKTGVITSDLGNLTLSNTFANNPNLTVIQFNSSADIPVLNLINSFKNCPKLETIAGVLDLSSNTSCNGAFSGCTYLQIMKLKNIKAGFSLVDCAFITIDTLDYLVSNAANTDEI